MVWAYVAATLGTAVVCALAAALAWRHRRVSSGLPLAGLMAAIAWWSATYAAEALATTVPDKIALSKLQYVGVAGAVTLYLVFALVYSHRERWLTRRRLALLWLLPLMSPLLAATNEAHGLIWTDVALVELDGRPIALYSHGPAFLPVVLYLYGYLAAGFALFWQSLRRFPREYRQRTIAILVGSAVPFLWSVVYVAGLSPIRSLDFTPVAFAVTGLVMLWAILRHQLLDLVPIARDVLVESMGDAVLVLDGQGQIVDLNPSARRLLTADASPLVGQRAADVLASWRQALAADADAAGPTQSVAAVEVGGAGQRHFDLKLTQVRDRRGRPLGRLVVLRDVTELRLATEQLRAQLAEIEALQATLREQAIRDPLTSLFNRRYLEETLLRELARARREGRPVGVVMLDVDHFKRLNDTHGHRAGDFVLQTLASLLRSHSRQADVACRYGGEEFAVALPGAPPEVVWSRAEQWRIGLETAEVPWQGRILRATVSAGVAGFPHDGGTPAELLEAADRALYAAKAAGRNRVVVFDRSLSGTQPRHRPDQGSQPHATA